MEKHTPQSLPLPMGQYLRSLQYFRNALLHNDRFGVPCAGMRRKMLPQKSPAPVSLS